MNRSNPSAAALGLIAAALALAACGPADSGAPRVAQVEPATVGNLRDAEVTVRGVGFHHHAHNDLDSDEAPAIDRTWGVELGGTSLAEVSWLDAGAIAVTVPAGFAVGTYDVVVRGAGGERAVLEDGLTVVADPIGLLVSIETAAGGGGQPLEAASLRAGEQLDVFAVLRDDEGAFFGDVAVSWSADPIGAVAAGPSTAASFQARTVGVGRVHADHAVAAGDQTGDIAVSAGDAARIAIEDAAGGTGSEVDDMTGLTTDGAVSLHAVARDSFGNYVAGAQATWSVSGAIGSIAAGPSASAVLDLTAPGVGRVEVADATDAGLGGDQTGDLVVAAGAAVSLVISPATLSVSADAAPVTFSCSGTDGDGNTTTDIGAITWSVASGPITSLSAATGIFDPVRAGTGTVRAASSHGAFAVSGAVTVAPGDAAALAISPATLSVSADDAPVTFSVSGTDADGNTTTALGDVTWSIASGPITSIAADDGVFTPAAGGSGRVRATSSLGPSAVSGLVTVNPGAAASLAVSPDTLTVVQGGADVAFAVSGTDGDGNPTADVGSIVWSVATGPITSMAAGGAFSPATPGSGTVRAVSSHGPADDSGAITVLQQATLDPALSAPARVSEGQSFTVSLSVANVGESAAAGVLPCALTLGGSSAGSSIAAGPTPASAAIAAGDAALFQWQVTAGSAGSLDLETCAAGADAATGDAVASGDATASVPVQEPPALSAAIAIPAAVSVDDTFTVTMVVDNGGEAGASLVAPGELTASGTGAASLVSGPSPASASIGGGGDATFTWTYRADSVGTLALSGSAAGSDENSGAAVASAGASSNTADITEGVELLAEDPFGDGSTFSFVVGFGDQLYLGPSQDGGTAVRMDPDGTAAESLAFTFTRDSSGSNTHRNSASPPYTSIGSAGCNDDTQECGPDNEDGRGLLAAGTIGGTEWLVLMGARSSGNFDYVYMTPDTDAALDFRYVDIDPATEGEMTTASALHVFGDRVYVGFASTGGNRPYLDALLETPLIPGLNADDDDEILNLDADDMPGMQTAGFAMIDSMTDFNGRLYLASAGNWFRADVAAPDPYSGAASDWRQCRPSAAAYGSKASLLVAVSSEIEPEDKAVPQMAAFNGRLYAARNTTSGPQLWRCQPGLNADPTQCDQGDWSLMAANSTGDTQLSQFNDTANARVTMLAATASHLYVGYNNAGGITVFRSSTADPVARADFEGEAGCSASLHPGSCAGLGGPGLGDPSTQRIFDARALALGGAPSAVYLTAGNSDDPVRVFRLTP